jgi:DNA-directed RNA polymerase subunit RPC12/RpoP
MLCTNCSSVIQDTTSIYCNKCGNKLIQKETYAHNTVKNSEFVNIGKDNNINVTSNYYSGNQEALVYYEKILQRPISYPVNKITKFTIVMTLLSLFGNFASIAGFFGLNLSNIINIPKIITISFWVITIIGIFVLLTILQLKSAKTTKIPLFRGDFITLDLDEENYIVSSRYIVADCPICPGKIIVRKITENSQERFIGICTDNQQHIYTFDHQTMIGSRIYY